MFSNRQSWNLGNMFLFLLNSLRILCQRIERWYVIFEIKLDLFYLNILFLLLYRRLWPQQLLAFLSWEICNILNVFLNKIFDLRWFSRKILLSIWRDIFFLATLEWLCRPRSFHFALLNALGVIICLVLPLLEIFSLLVWCLMIIFLLFVNLRFKLMSHQLNIHGLRYRIIVANTLHTLACWKFEVHRWGI